MQSPDCARVTQSPDCMLNLEIRMQSWDSENAQHNLEIAQMLRLRGTYILLGIAYITETQNVG